GARPESPGTKGEGFEKAIVQFLPSTLFHEVCDCLADQRGTRPRERVFNIQRRARKELSGSFGGGQAGCEVTHVRGSVVRGGGNAKRSERGRGAGRAAAREGGGGWRPSLAAGFWLLVRARAGSDKPGC